ncbi:MAG: type II secretion system F family protein [Lachnospiraceae bacterium]
MGKLKIFLKASGGCRKDCFHCFQDEKVFVAYSIGFGVLGAILGGSINVQMGFVGFVVGLCMLSATIYLSNQRDNKIIMNDLKWLYETIAIQIQAGLHINQALYESDSLIKSPRLRKRLREVSMSLLTGAELEETLQEFEECFQNEYINTFCIIIKQAKESGFVVQLFEDIGEQLEVIERMNLQRSKQNLELQLQLFELMLFLGFLALIMYGCVIVVIENITF